MVLKSKAQAHDRRVLQLVHDSTLIFYVENLQENGNEMFYLNENLTVSGQGGGGSTLFSF